MMRLFDGRGFDALALDPFAIFDRITRDMDAIFGGTDSFAAFRPFSLLSPAWWSSEVTSAQLRSGIYETDDAVHFYAEVPGSSAEDVTLSIDKGVLNLSVKRQHATPEGYRLLEGRRGSAEASARYALPCEVDADAAEAKVEHGVLSVRLPKHPDSMPKQIQVKVD